MDWQGEENHGRKTKKSPREIKKMQIKNFIFRVHLDYIETQAYIYSIEMTYTQ